MTTKATSLDPYDEALKYVAEELGMFFQGNAEKAVYWMMTPNPLLGDVVPAWLMLSHPNGPHKLMAFVKNCRQGDIA